MNHCWFLFPICFKGLNQVLTKKFVLCSRVSTAAALCTPSCDVNCQDGNRRDGPLDESLAAGCNRCCRLAVYGLGKGASVGERPIREHFLAVNGENVSVHSSVRLRSLPWMCIAKCSNFSKDRLAWAASSQVSNCTDSTTNESSVFAVIVTRAC